MRSRGTPLPHQQPLGTPRRGRQGPETLPDPPGRVLTGNRPGGDSSGALRFRRPSGDRSLSLCARGPRLCSGRHLKLGSRREHAQQGWGGIPWTNSVSPGLPGVEPKRRPDQSAREGAGPCRDSALAWWGPRVRCPLAQLCVLIGALPGQGGFNGYRLTSPGLDLGSPQRKLEELFKGLLRPRRSPEGAEGTTAFTLTGATDPAPRCIPEHAASSPLVPGTAPRPRPSVQPSPLVPPPLLVPPTPTGPAPVHLSSPCPWVQPPLTEHGHGHLSFSHHPGRWGPGWLRSGELRGLGCVPGPLAGGGRRDPASSELTPLPQGAPGPRPPRPSPAARTPPSGRPYFLAARPPVCRQRPLVMATPLTALSLASLLLL